VRIARIVKEDGKYCVKSENPSSTWSGGCYSTKEEAEDRLREIEYFKSKSAAHSVTLRYAMAEGIAFDKLKSMSQAELKKLGLGVWSIDGEVSTMLFPAGWYKDIPSGFEVVDINGGTEKFEPGKSGGDLRTDYLLYGIEVKVVKRFSSKLRANP
jgi:hypothetical protein